MKRQRTKRPRQKKARRIPVTLRMTPETKGRLDASALANGRSQSAEIEALIEKALNYDEVLRGMRTSVAEIVKGQVEAAMRSAGYITHRTPHGDVWLPPGYPVPRSGFIDPEEEEHK
jgi:hypothetical protein